MSKALFHSCPICSTPVSHSVRYPRAVCRACCAKACDIQGQKLVFFNLSISGGFGAMIADTKQEYPSHICYIEGNPYWADEARFGGIVIQAYDKQL